jgi:tetratricopeptide (TPR) repeat protein
LLIDPGYCLNLDKLKVYFLEGNYRQAIIEAEKILSSHKESSGLDEVYYLLGLCYLKEGDYLKAQNAFEIILREFKKSRFKEEAKLGLADTFLLRADAVKAQAYYQEIIKSNPDTKLKTEILQRLNQKESDKTAVSYYTVQVGVFVNHANADSLMRELIQKGYSAYIEESEINGMTSYRVRAGKMFSRQEVMDLERKLINEGYPTKICP